LNNQYTRQIERSCLAAFFAPEAQERLFVIAHDDPGIRAADELAPVDPMYRLGHLDISL
jgi:hypothetical protein